MAGWRDDHGTVTRADDDLDRRGVRPGALRDAQVADAGVRDQAVVDGDDLVRAMFPQARHSVITDRELDPGSPAESRLAAGLAAGHRLDGDLAVDAGHPPQLLPDHGGLQGALRGEAGVLPVAAAAAAGVRVRARRGHPVLRRLADLDGVRPREPGRDLGHPGDDPLAWQRVPDEQHGKPRRPGDAPAALRDVLGRHLDSLAYLENHRTDLLVLGSHSPM